MKSDFLIAITQLSAEKNLPKETVIAAVEAALASTYKKENFAANQNISVKINPNTGGIEVWVEKEVVELVTDSRREISLDEAQHIKTGVQLGETILLEATPQNAGRIAAQTAKQVILQRLREAEHSTIFEEYTDKQGDIVTGIVQHIEPKQVFIDLGRTEAILPAAEQVPSERYRIGQRLKVYLLEVVQTSKGPRVVVSRSHPDLLRWLFKMEISEVANGTVEIKSIAREAGHRSKVAVTARQSGVDPVGCCVGLRGIRIQNIVSELQGEKIDVVAWNPDASIFIANALSPAQVLSVKLDRAAEVATVVVPDKQLSLAIGKEGQNVRLAAKLAGWRIDIKSASAAEAEKEIKAEVPLEVEPEAAAEEKPSVEMPAMAEQPEIAEEPVTPEVVEEPVSTKGEVTEATPVAETVFEPPIPFKPPVTEQPRELRFAEDILVSAPTKVGTAKTKKGKKKGSQGRRGDEDSIKVRRPRREVEIPEEDEEY